MNDRTYCPPESKAWKVRAVRLPARIRDCKDCGRGVECVRMERGVFDGEAWAVLRCCRCTSGHSCTDCADQADDGPEHDE